MPIVTDTWLECVVICTRCGKSIKGRIGFDRTNRIADSEGFVVFGDGAECDGCLDRSA